MMKFENNPIMFTLVYKDEEYKIQTGRNKYHTLMPLISDHLIIDGFGLCSGMGSCGTCMVEIQENESFIRKVTLSCNVYINDELANTKIIIPEAIS